MSTMKNLTIHILNVSTN